jgi:hypothetical protein
MVLRDWLLLKEKFLRRISGGITVNERRRKRYNKELMQLFEGLDTLSLAE